RHRFAPATGSVQSSSTRVDGKRSGQTVAWSSSGAACAQEQPDMNTVKLQVRIAYLQNQLTQVNYDLASLVEQLASKQFRLDSWYANQSARLTRHKAALVGKLAETRRAKQRSKRTVPRT